MKKTDWFWDLFGWSKYVFYNNILWLRGIYLLDLQKAAPEFFDQITKEDCIPIYAVVNKKKQNRIVIRVIFHDIHRTT